MGQKQVAVIGAGIGGLTAAADLARQGFGVTVFERASGPGGKLRSVAIDDQRLDAGPTVFTLRNVFEDLFADAGEAFAEHVTLLPAQILARHAWRAGEHLDLFADSARSADAIARFAGSTEADGYRRFAAQAKRIYDTLDRSFMRAPRPSPAGLVRRVGMRRLPDMLNIQPFATLWQSLGGYFKDPRLRQLFGRYATYCGSSPFLSPATLMLIAHVEQAGVWYVEGGMHCLATALAAFASRQGASIAYGSEITRIHLERGNVSGVELKDGRRVAADMIVSNADNNALAAGLFGSQAAAGVAATPVAARSLSAVTCNLVAQTSGFELAHHSVFFSGDYRAEFEDVLLRRRLPLEPTVYVCAQDRRDLALASPGAPERLLCLINAPAVGDTHVFDDSEMHACEALVFERLARFGLRIQPRTRATVMTPADFETLYPATGGALYGPASHGWAASFKRPGSRSRIPGLYLAGGSTHPGPGVPMAALSGRLAAASIAADHASTRRWRTAGMPGGMSMD